MGARSYTCCITLGLSRWGYTLEPVTGSMALSLCTIAKGGDSLPCTVDISLLRGKVQGRKL